MFSSNKVPRLFLSCVGVKARGAPADTIAVRVGLDLESTGAVAVEDLRNVLGVVPVQVGHGHHEAEHELSIKRQQNEFKLLQFKLFRKK